MLPSYLQPFYWDSQAKSEHLKASGPSRPTESTIETESSYPRESQKAKPEHRKRPLEIGSTTDRTHHFEYQSDSSSKRARHTTDQTLVTKAPEFSVDDGHGSTSNTDVQTSSGQGKLREDPARLSKIGHWLDSYTSAVYHRPKGLRKERCHTKPSLSPESANRSEGASPILSEIITDANKALPEPIKTRAVESLGLPEQDQEWLKMARKEMEMATYITYLSDPSDDLAFECWKRAVSGGRAESVIPRPTSEIIGRIKQQQHQTRTHFVECCRPQILSWYKFLESDAESVASRVRYLLDQKRFQCPEEHYNVGGYRFCAPQLREALGWRFYGKPRRSGWEHEGMEDEINGEFICFLTTVLEFLLREFNTGVHVKARFSMTRVRPIYHQHWVTWCYLQETTRQKIVADLQRYVKTKRAEKGRGKSSTESSLPKPFVDPFDVKDREPGFPA